MREAWQEELKSAIRSVSELAGYAFLKNSSQSPEKDYRTLVPRYYLSLIDPSDAEDPIAKMAFPREDELFFTDLGRRDPIGDQDKLAAPRLTHRYRDRALLHTTNLCPMYCRFCFRKNLMNETEEDLYSGEFDPAFEYLVRHPEIEELIFTGGDPWMLSSKKIEQLLIRVASELPRIRRLRFHTRMPVTLPSRVNQDLLDVLKQRYPFQIIVVTHFNHPKECSDLAKAAIEKLKSVGVLLLNQTVLLNGVNHEASILRDLWMTLGGWGVMPYYLHHCDLVKGAEHFRVSLEEGRRVFRELRGSMPGYFLPHYVLDRPGGAGKISAEASEIFQEQTNFYRIPGVPEVYEDIVTIQ